MQARFHADADFFVIPITGNTGVSLLKSLRYVEQNWPHFNATVVADTARGPTPSCLPRARTRSGSAPPLRCVTSCPPAATTVVLPNRSTCCPI